MNLISNDFYYLHDSNYTLFVKSATYIKIKILSFIVFTLFSTVAMSQLSIVSWNLKDFGQSRDDVEMKMIANVIEHADIIAIQEVVAKHPGGAKAVARLADVLNRTGSKWDYKISDPTQNSSPHKRERYAFLWKTSKVKLSKRPYLVATLSTIVDREPYVINFSYNGEPLVIVNYHACTHKPDNPERKEIESISNWLLSKEYKNVIWAGDMNLVITDIAFETILQNGYKSVLHGEKTSLKKTCKDGNYLSRAEDNILYNFSTLNFNDGKVLDFIKAENCHNVGELQIKYSDHLGVEIKI